MKKSLLIKLFFFIIFFLSLLDLINANNVKNTEKDSPDLMELISKNKESLLKTPLPKQNFLNGLQILRVTKDEDHPISIMNYGVPLRSFAYENVINSVEGPAIIGNATSVVILKVILLDKNIKLNKYMNRWKANSKKI